ncbi:MAG: hypothetical protein SGI89_02300 [bacterium]|nr:hypothetical protein [bacterium]
MKSIYFVITALLLFIAAGCGSNSTGGGIIGPGGGGNVSFTISGTPNGQNYDFGFKPNVDVKVTTLIVGLPAQPFFDTIQNGNPAYVFSKDTVYNFGPYTGVQSQQAWTFQFAGTENSNGTAYSTTANFVIP